MTLSVKMSIHDYDDEFTWIRINRGRITHFIRNVKGRKTSAFNEFPCYDLTASLLMTLNNKLRIRVKLVCGCVFFASICGVHFHSGPPILMFNKVKHMCKDVKQRTAILDLSDITHLTIFN